VLSIRSEVRRRLISVLAFCLAVATAASCSAGKGVRTGTEVVGVGPQSQGVLGFEKGVARVGRTYGFAFPFLKNSGSSSLTVTGYGMHKLPMGAKLTQIRVISASDRGGYVLNSYVGDGTVGDGTRTDFSTYRNRAAQRLTLLPGEQSDLYAVIYLKVTGTPKW
jgi:hypothetical protein